MSDGKMSRVGVKSDVFAVQSALHVVLKADHIEYINNNIDIESVDNADIMCMRTYKYPRICKQWLGAAAKCICFYTSCCNSNTLHLMCLPFSTPPLTSRLK